MFCFEILEKNRKSAKTGKSGHYRALMPQRREPTPLCRPMPRRGTPSSRARPRCQNGTPWVRHGVAAIHREQFLDFVYEHLVFIH